MPSVKPFSLLYICMTTSHLQALSKLLLIVYISQAIQSSTKSGRPTVLMKMITSFAPSVSKTLQTLKKCNKSYQMNNNQQRQRRTRRKRSRTTTILYKMLYMQGLHLDTSCSLSIHFCSPLITIRLIRLFPTLSSRPTNNYLSYNKQDISINNKNTLSNTIISTKLLLKYYLYYEYNYINRQSTV